MLEIVTITFKAFGKVSSKDIVVPSQNCVFDDFDTIKRVCISDFSCSDFVVLNVKFSKVEVLS